MTGAGTDDHALGRVPRGARYSWVSVALARFGQVSALSQFLVGSTLGFGMQFWDAVLAITLGSVILQVVAIAVGVIGVREGMTTAMLTRWTGFGAGGAALLGIVFAVTNVGWFGVQAAVSAKGLASIMPGVPFWVWALGFGIAITVLVIYGFRWVTRVAWLAVPSFMLLVLWICWGEFGEHSISELISEGPAGPSMSIVEGATFVAGGFIVGAVITPDLTRFNRSSADVVKQTVVGIAFGEYVVALIGVLLAYGARSADVVTILTSSAGWLGVLVILLGTVKINNLNLYVAGLGLVNSLGTVLGRHVGRATTTAVLGLFGSLMAAAGILGHFVGFLSLLGVAFPPVAAIMVAEYFVVRRWRGDLDRTRDLGVVPDAAPKWVPASLGIWLLASTLGYVIDWGIPSVNSVVLGFVLYCVAGRLGWLRSYGVTRTRDAEDSSAATVSSPASTGAPTDAEM